MLFVLVDDLAVLGEILLGFDDRGVGVADGVELLVGKLVVRGNRNALLFAGTEVWKFAAVVNTLLYRPGLSC